MSTQFMRGILLILTFSGTPLAVAQYYGKCVEGTCWGYNTEGKFIFDNGHSYEGGFQHDELHGFGVFRSAEGWRYEGNFHYSDFLGYGIYYFEDGRIYKGRWENSKYYAFGIVQDANGNELEAGYWQDGELIATKASMKAARARLEDLKKNNNQNSKIINAIKFAKRGDSAKFHNSKRPIEEQMYAFDACIYYEIYPSDKEDEDGEEGLNATVYAYDFNKVNWKSVSKKGFGEDATVSLSCEDVCRTWSRYYVADPAEYKWIKFKAMPNISRTYSALNDIKAECPGYSSPY